MRKFVVALVLVLVASMASANTFVIDDICHMCMIINDNHEPLSAMPIIEGEYDGSDFAEIAINNEFTEVKFTSGKSILVAGSIDKIDHVVRGVVPDMRHLVRIHKKFVEVDGFIYDLNNNAVVFRSGDFHIMNHYKVKYMSIDNGVYDLWAYDNNNNEARVNVVVKALSNIIDSNMSAVEIIRNYNIEVCVDSTLGGLLNN